MAIINIKKKHIIIGTVYRPNTPPKADVDIFSNTMQELQGIMHRENKDAFIMGDMNIDLLQYSNHYKTNDYTEAIFSQGYLPPITKPTRLTSHSATLIDHIYTNSRSSEITSGIIVTDISDHFGIFSTIQLTTHNAQTTNYTTSRSYNKANIDLFKHFLSCTDFMPVLHITCPDQAYDKFMDIFTETHDIAFPLKQKRIPKRYLKRSVWMTNGPLQSSITKSKLFMKKLKKPSNSNINKYKHIVNYTMHFYATQNINTFKTN